jgi:hypothetical protein
MDHADIVFHLVANGLRGGCGAPSALVTPNERSISHLLRPACVGQVHDQAGPSGASSQSRTGFLQWSSRVRTHAGLRRQTTSGGMSETGTGFPALMPRTLGGIFVSPGAHDQADFYQKLIGLPK